MKLSLKRQPEPSRQISLTGVASLVDVLNSGVCDEESCTEPSVYVRLASGDKLWFHRDPINSSDDTILTLPDNAITRQIEESLALPETLVRRGRLKRHAAETSKEDIA